MQKHTQTHTHTDTDTHTHTAHTHTHTHTYTHARTHARITYTQLHTERLAYIHTLSDMQKNTKHKCRRMRKCTASSAPRRTPPLLHLTLRHLPRSPRPRSLTPLGCTTAGFVSVAVLTYQGVYPKTLNIKTIVVFVLSKCHWLRRGRWSAY